jgi:hypothetical protein
VKTGLLKQAISFVRDFTAYAGIAGARASALAVIAATFDGVGLLLVPMLSIVTGTETGNTNRLLTQAFDILEAQTRAARITLMLTMFVALVVVRAVAVARRNINLSRLQADYVEMIRSSLARRLAAAPWPVVSRLQHARVTHLMSGDINRIGPRRTTWCRYGAGSHYVADRHRLCARAGAHDRCAFFDRYRGGGRFSDAAAGACPSRAEPGLLRPHAPLRKRQSHRR